MALLCIIQQENLREKMIWRSNNFGETYDQYSSEFLGFLSKFNCSSTNFPNYLRAGTYSNLQSVADILIWNTVEEMQTARHKWFWGAYQSVNLKQGQWTHEKASCSLLGYLEEMLSYFYIKAKSDMSHWTHTQLSNTCFHGPHWLPGIMRLTWVADVIHSGI